MKSARVTRQLTAQFRREVRSGRWSVDRPIPTEQQLAQEYNASRNTIRAALKQLEERGWLRAVQGSGRRLSAEVPLQHAKLGLLVRGSGDVARGQGRQFVMAAMDAASRRGHTLITYSINRSDSESTGARELALMESDLSDLDGVMVLAQQYQLEDIERFAAWMPTAAINHDATGVDVPSFLIDYGLHAAVAVGRLVEAGHRRIALLQFDDRHKRRQATDIRRGFELGRQHAGLPLDDGLIVTYQDRESSATATTMIAECIDAITPPPTAVISYSSWPLQHLARTHPRLELVCLADLSDPGLQLGDVTHFRCPFDCLMDAAMTALDGMLRGAKPKHLYNPFYGQFTSNRSIAPLAPAASERSQTWSSSAGPIAPSHAE